MYALLVNLELITVMLYVIISLLAASKASRLIYNQTENQLNRRTRSMLYWTICLTLLAAIIASADIALALTAHPPFQLDRLLVCAPLAAIPILLIWLCSFPRLRKLTKRTSGRTEAIPDVARRRQASNPACIVPYQLAALCSAALCCLAFMPPTLFEWTAMTIPATLFILLACLLWLFQTHRNQLAAAAPLSLRPWRRRLTHTIIILTAAGLLLHVIYEGVTPSYELGLETYNNR